MMKKSLLLTLLALLVLSFVLSGIALADTVVGSGGSSNIRTAPDLNAKSIGTLPKGASAYYLDRTSYDYRGVAWYKISYGSKSGWVSSRYTKLYIDYPPSPSQGTIVVATKGASNIRSLPSLSGRDIGTLPRGASAVYLNEYSVDYRNVVWYKISYGSTIGWISSRYTRLQ